MRSGYTQELISMGVATLAEDPAATILVCTTDSHRGESILRRIGNSLAEPARYIPSRKTVETPEGGSVQMKTSQKQVCGRVVDHVLADWDATWGLVCAAIPCERPRVA